jgi:hypothetical protein
LSCCVVLHNVRSVACRCAALHGTALRCECPALECFAFQCATSLIIVNAIYFHYVVAFLNTYYSMSNSDQSSHHNLSKGRNRFEILSCRAQHSTDGVERGRILFATVRILHDVLPPPQVIFGVFLAVCLRVCLLVCA